jgi:hypothetical protein
MIGLSALRAAGLALAAATLAACSPTDHRIIAQRLRAQLVHQYHECVPLGWNPVPVAGTFYPGSNLVLQEEGVWLPSLWLARVRKRDLARRDARAISEVLDRLVAAGMLKKSGGGGGFRYQLTTRALPFYYSDNAFGDNLAGESYLCYSTIVPQRVVWNQAIHRERGRDGAEVEAFRAAFEWSPSPAAGWANDPVIRRHSVILSPSGNPMIAKFVNSDSAWTVQELRTSDVPLPRVADASAWPGPPPKLSARRSGS